MRTSELISNLSCELKPQRVLPSDLKFIFFSLIFVFAALLCAILAYPLRRDFTIEVNKISFYLETGAMLLIACSSALVSYRSSLGGAHTKRQLAFVTICIFFLVFEIILRSSSPDTKAEFFGELQIERGECTLHITEIAVFLSLIVFLLSKKLAPIKIHTTAAAASLSGIFSAAFLIQFSCYHANSIHILLWHILPMSILTLVGTLAGAKFLKS